ncbi:TerB family tellurite resistance protein [Paenibacillus thailandensis]|uniref:TerB family tellurite resistance protein n=1 Tax=Paenibacillus thailandensis TaxID=393250 RepID=A0ABW5QU44_9BACL
MFLHFIESDEYKYAFLEIAHLAAKADGFVSRNEEGALRSFMAEMNMEDAGIEFSANRSLEQILGGIDDPRVKQIYFLEILMLAFSDGNFNDDEKQIVKDMKRLIGVTDEAYAACKNWVERLDKLKVEGLKLILEP